MGTVSEKLTYLNGTKSVLKDIINLTNAGITNDTTFRNYANKLYDGYVATLKNKYTLLDNMPRETVTGTNINIQDAVDLPVYEDKMSKESTQETTTGKNILNLLKNQSYTFQANTNSYAGANSGSPVAYVSMTAGVKYYISYNITSSTTSSRNTAMLFKPDGNNSFEKIATNYNTTAGRKVWEYTPTETGRYGFNYWCGQPNVDVTLSDIMISTDSDTTYEPYTNGPSPNPDYPQEIETVKGYRNLFNMLDFVAYKATIQTLTSKKIVLTAKTTSGAQFVANYVKNVDSTKTYILSLKGKKVQSTGDLKNLRGYFYGSNDDSNYTQLGNMNIGGVVGQEYSYSITLTGYKYYRVYLYNYSNATVSLGETTEYYDIQFTEGTQILPFVPYGTNWIYKKVNGKNFLQILLTDTNTTDGITYTPNSDNSITISGTRGSNGSGPRFAKVTIKANQTYYLMCIDKNTNLVANIPVQLYGTIGTYRELSPNRALTFSTSGEFTLSIKGSNTGSQINGTYYFMLYTSYTSSYEPYQENIVTIPLNDNEICGKDDYKDELIIDKGGHCWLNKKTRRIELVIADMNNGEQYPGWTNVTELLTDFPSKNGILNTPFNCNITTNHNLIGINTVFLSGNGTLFLYKQNSGPFSLTETEWKTNYPNLIFKIIYGLQTPELIDLNYTVDLSLFKGNNIITNSEDMDMEIKYVQDISAIIN